MLPSARAGMPSASVSPRGNEGNIGEGRRSRSRSNSIDSVTTELSVFGGRNSSVDSDDDDGVSTIARRAVGFQWGQNQTQNTFGLGEDSEFSLFATRQSETNVILGSGTPFASSLGLPSKVYRGPDAFSAFAAQSSLPDTSLVAYPPPTIENDDDVTASFRDLMPSLPIATSSGVFYQAETQTRSSEHPSHTTQEISPIDSSADPATTDNVATDPSVAKITPDQTSPGSSSEAGQDQNTTEKASSHASSSRQPIPFSIHNFFASAPLSYPGSPGDVSRKSSANDVPSRNLTHETTPPPVHQRNTEDSSTASAQTPDNDLSTVTENTESNSPQASAPTPKKRRLRSDTERKRGKWRVDMHSVSTTSTPEPERPLSTLPGKPLFSTADLNPLGPTPLPYFEYRESRDRTKRSAVNHAVQRDAASESAVAPTDDDNDLADHQTFDDFRDDGFDTAYSFDVDTDVSTCADDRAPDHPPSALSPHPSVRSVGQASSRSPERGTTAMIGSARPDGVASSTDRSTASIPDARTPAPSGNRVVSIIIEDRRWEHAEPSLVELSLPLRPDSSGGFWLDAVDLCKALQSGPSRIDGPAKAYAYRGRFRLYFLRVSSENVDNFVPANLVVPADLFLRAIVEPMVPSSNRQTTEATPHLTLPRPPSTSTQLASPALSEECLPMPSNRSDPGPSKPRPKKRGRAQTTPTASGSGTSSNAPSRAQNTTGTAPDAAPSSTSYYRKRAL